MLHCRGSGRRAGAAVYPHQGFEHAFACSNEHTTVAASLQSLSTTAGHTYIGDVKELRLHILGFDMAQGAVEQNGVQHTCMQVCEWRGFH